METGSNKKGCEIEVGRLPVGESPEAVAFPHFPTVEQAFIWRNWGLVSFERLAGILGTDACTVKSAGELMGLPVPEKVDEGLWLRRGYVTLIRRNWHLLPYEQLLELLGWSVERLLNVLKEEDFLWNKLGMLKPACKVLKWRELTAAEVAATERLRAIVEPEVALLAGVEREEPFAFLRHHAHRPSGPVRSDADRFELRLTYSFSTLYGDPLTDGGGEFFADEELAAMQSWGVNAVWFQAILYTLYPWDLAPGLSEGWQRRLETLRDLVGRAAKYGIAVYLYLNEPRNLSAGAFADYPALEGLRGVHYPPQRLTGLCTSVDAVGDFLEEATAHVFREVPGLGGVFTITMSENPTHCHSHRRGDECPRCAGRSVPEVIAGVNRRIAAGIHSVAPAARVLAWDWSWDPEFSFDVVDALPDDVELLCTSGFMMPITVGGADALVSDYSIAHPGPGPHVAAMWQRAIGRGLKVHAKVQINNSWECSTVPYIPVPDRVEQHLRQVHEAGASGIMYSWSLGGYLGGNLSLLTAGVDEWADVLGGDQFGPVLRRAWQLLSDAFVEFPYNIQVVYCGPTNAGAANLLYLDPTGYRATMVCFPYDDVDHWHSTVYSPEIFEQQLLRLSERWLEGLRVLDEAAAGSDGLPEAVEDVRRIAGAVYCTFRSGAIQTRFLHLRNRHDPGCHAEMLQILEEEVELARTNMRLAWSDSRIGYEPTNHYVYTPLDLLEKVVNCTMLSGELMAKK